MARRGFAFLLACVALISPIPASADDLSTDTNIITGLDVSSSINAQEAQLQIEGMAQAIRSPSILAAIQHGKHSRIGFAVFVWADGDCVELIPWRVISSTQEAEAAAAEIAARLDGVLSNSTRFVGSLTNLSGAMEYAEARLQAAPFNAERTVLNVVGNGQDNVGESTERARAALLSHGTTINGIVIGGDKRIVDYYREEVIGGPTAFVLSANDAETMAQVFAMKFTTEIALHAVAAPRPDRL
ncbi:MAG TPA: DUF1194 domain-containing protein [Dongiaceae bacterium]|nr:DUF1194 domain-containing protein [Dongiaceae bacterium]